jgi:hypothetical protein
LCKQGQEPVGFGFHHLIAPEKAFLERPYASKPLDLHASNSAILAFLASAL